MKPCDNFERKTSMKRLIILTLLKFAESNEMEAKETETGIEIITQWWNESKLRKFCMDNNIPLTFVSTSKFSVLW